MRLSDFQIGSSFQTSSGQHWRCTDVGARTIMAIELKPELEESWFYGPPFVVTEVHFNEGQMEAAFRSLDDDKEYTYSDHPGFPSEVVGVINETSFSDDSENYPRKGILQVDRVGLHGEIFNPYGVERDGDMWFILVYELFSREFSKMNESDFVRMRNSTEADMNARAQSYVDLD